MSTISDLIMAAEIFRQAMTLIGTRFEIDGGPKRGTVVIGTVKGDIHDILHWDQDWTRDLARLQELPAKKCILNPDGMSDMRKFKELVGDRMAMLGDVPASLLATGTPDDVRNYVRGRAELFEGKGLLICPGCDAPIDAKAENMEALVQAAYDYGTIGT